ncbi:MAG: GGDEF domain-containing protein [Armatimonadota bacterium]|nr:GGDEF domain-containing protein [Armatimonadota bacterium]MDR7445311.1 GGDEF domain-containing protein [Armatimonadota bacterium]MDR7569793.1 GGDEF domain-containing protein [Armatimonadota bacterium]MDR7614046.1 GGDEF domain-containing protein [Armatimonadota bacterium]
METRVEQDEERRRRSIQARQIALSGIGHLSGFVILLLIRHVGLASFSDLALVGVAGLGGGGIAALYGLARTGLHRVLFPWDRHWVYVPLAFTIVLLNLQMLLAPAARWLLIHGWLAALAMASGYVRFLPALGLTAAMGGMYLAWAIHLPGTTGVRELLPVLNVGVSAWILAMVSERVRARRLEVRGLTEQLREANQRLAEMALRDPLTDAFNRRYLEEQLTLEVERARRSGKSLVVAMMDLDGFKQYNDTHGHLAGDHVLRLAAAAMRASVRRGDLVARYGGDEFAVVLVDIAPQDALQVLERIRNAVASLRLADGESARRITLSVGAARFPGDGGTAQELLSRADEALYRAKSGGGNRVEFAGVTGDPCGPTPGNGMAFAY